MCFGVQNRNLRTISDSAPHPSRSTRGSRSAVLRTISDSVPHPFRSIRGSRIAVLRTIPDLVPHPCHDSGVQKRHFADHSGLCCAPIQDDPGVADHLGLCCTPISVDSGVQHRRFADHLGLCSAPRYVDFGCVETPFCGSSRTLLHTHTGRSGGAGSPFCGPSRTLFRTHVGNSGVQKRRLRTISDSVPHPHRSIRGSRIAVSSTISGSVTGRCASQWETQLKTERAGDAREGCS